MSLLIVSLSQIVGNCSKCGSVNHGSLVDLLLVSGYIVFYMFCTESPLFVFCGFFNCESYLGYF